MFDHLPDQPWDDTPTSPAAIALATAQAWITGTPEDRRMIDRMLADQRQRQHDQQRDDLTDWLWPGSRMAVVRQPVWLGDDDHDPVTFDF